MADELLSLRSWPSSAIALHKGSPLGSPTAMCPLCYQADVRVIGRPCFTRLHGRAMHLRGGHIWAAAWLLL